MDWHEKRNTIDPISLKEIDDCNEWLTGRVDDEEDEAAEDDLVFDDNYLTWGVVADAAGATEPPRSLRSQSKTSTSFVRSKGKRALVEVEEDEDDIDSHDSEEEDAFDCDQSDSDEDEDVDLPDDEDEE
jgi:hypothetical protein